MVLKRTAEYDCFPEQDELSGAINPKALGFLQAVFGPNDMLEDMTQQQAHTLAGDMMQTYFDTYDTDIGAYGGYKLTAEDQQRLRGIVDAHLDGATAEQIAHDTPDYGTAEQISIELTDIIAGLHAWDEQPLERRADTGPVTSLQYVREQHEYLQSPPLFGTFEAGVISQPRSEWLQDNAEAARLRLEAYVASPAFQHAVRREGRHEKDSEVFEIGHEAHTYTAAVIGRAAEYYLAYKFAEKDGDRLAGLGFYDKPDLNTLYLLVGYKPDGTATVSGALFDREQDEDGMVPAFQSIPESYGQPIVAAFKADNIPDLLDSNETTEIVAVATDVPADALKLYNAACLRALKRGKKHFVANLDREAGNSLAKYPGGFRMLESLGEVAFHTRIPGSNISGVYYCNLPGWQEALKEKRPAVYSFFWKKDNRLRRDCELTEVAQLDDGGDPERRMPLALGRLLAELELSGPIFTPK